jgi:methylase of polypeptide subunit release factors
VKTPASFDGIEIDVPGGKGIYPPSEDSYLLLGMVKRFLDTQSSTSIHDRARYPSLDMGVGAGLATLYLARHFKTVHAVDINPNALAFLKGALARQGDAHRVQLVAGDLLSSFRPTGGLGQYYLACFNPPYLPPEDYNGPGIQDDDEHGFYMDRALYAADGGRALLEAFLLGIKGRMMPGGHVFFIKSSLTSIGDQDVAEWTRDLGFTIVAHESIHQFFEDIEAFHVIT